MYKRTKYIIEQIINSIKSDKNKQKLKENQENLLKNKDVIGILAKHFSCLSSVPEKKTSIPNELTDGLTYRTDRQN